MKLEQETAETKFVHLRDDKRAKGTKFLWCPSLAFPQIHHEEMACGKLPRGELNSKNCYGRFSRNAAANCIETLMHPQQSWEGILIGILGTILRGVGR